MFEEHKAKKAAEARASALAYEQTVQTRALAEWQKQHEELSAVLSAALARQGSPSDDILLKSGEAVFATIANVSFIEDRRVPGTFSGGSQGFSIPVASVGGRSIRYRVGASKGHYVQGELHPQAVDSGKLFVTNKRAVFVGSKKAIECLFAKLVSAEVEEGELVLSVSNRQTVTRLHYGQDLDGWVHLRLTLALSIFRGDTEQFIVQCRQQLTELEAKRPAAPAA